MTLISSTLLLLFQFAFFSLPFLFLTFILLFLITHKPSFSSTKPGLLPPSPLKLPIIGNLHQLGSLPHQSLALLSKKHGPLMLLHFGQAPTLIVSSPEMAREIMKTQDHIFASRPSLKVPKSLFYDGNDVAFAPYGKYWRQVKKLSVIHLLSAKRVQSYRLIREEEVSAMVENVCGLSSAPIINLSRIMNCFAKDVMSRVALGKCPKNGESWSEAIGDVIEESSALIGAFHLGDYMPWLAWISAVCGLDARVEEVFRVADGFLDRIVEGRGEVIRSKGGDQNENDAFVDVLLSLEEDVSKSFHFDKQNIKAIIKDMFGAGIDSTSVVMEWAMAELLRNSDTMSKLKQEIKNTVGSKPVLIKEDDLTKMNYLKAVIKETLRLHPPAALLIPRESVKETKIKGYRIPEQTRVLVNVWAIGRDPDIWEAPEKFWPERFMGSLVDFRGQDFQFIPFGAGRRICPGIQFSVPIIELAITNLVHRFDWRLPQNMREEDMNMAEAPGLTARKLIKLHLVANPCLF